MACIHSLLWEMRIYHFELLLIDDGIYNSHLSDLKSYPKQISLDLVDKPKHCVFLDNKQFIQLFFFLGELQCDEPVVMEV